MKSEEINFRDSSIVDISGALYIFRIQYEFTQSQCEGGARDVNNIWVLVVIIRQRILWRMRILWLQFVIENFSKENYSFSTIIFLNCQKRSHFTWSIYSL